VARLLRAFKLELREAIEKVLGLGQDIVPVDLIGRLAGLDDGLLGALEIVHDSFHHADRLPQGAHVIVLGEGVLLEEVFSDDFCDLEGQLLVLG
jgi:hypothetical protein